MNSRETNAEWAYLSYIFHLEQWYFKRAMHLDQSFTWLSVSPVCHKELRSISPGPVELFTTFSWMPASERGFHESSRGILWFYDSHFIFVGLFGLFITVCLCFIHSSFSSYLLWKKCSLYTLIWLLWFTWFSDCSERSCLPVSLSCLFPHHHVKCRWILSLNE